MGVTPRLSEDRIEFSWDDERVQARPGEPIAVALWRAGVRTQTRSIKFHRARGPQCWTGDCPGCMVRVDGVPNVRGCQVPALDGMEVESQVGIPSASTDLLSIVDRVFEHFDHERSFVRPRVVRAVYEAVARQLAGFGTQPTSGIEVEEGDQLAADVLVVGGGPAGLAAAHVAASEGAHVLLVDEGGFGGSLRHTLRPVEADDWGPSPGPELAERMIRELPGEVDRVDGTVFGFYEDTIALAGRNGDRWAVHTVDAEFSVIAAGATEGPALVDGDDRPGVLPARAARILMNRWGVPPGDPVAVVDPDREGRAFAERATERGLTVHEVNDVQAIDGDPEVTGVRTAQGSVEAEAVVVDPGLTPAPELGRQAGIPYTYEAELGGRVPLAGPTGVTPVPGVVLAGSCAGLHVPEAALVQGGWAGSVAAGGEPTVEPGRLLEVPGISKPEREAIERVWRQA